MYPDNQVLDCMICNQGYDRGLLKTLGDCCSKKCFVRKQELVTEIRMIINEIQENSKI